jgi:hypothetical protein
LLVLREAEKRAAVRKPITILTVGIQKPNKETTMKLKSASLFMGICVAILAVAATSAFAARSNTAFSSFHVEGPLDGAGSADPYLCLNEDNGAVVNNCTYAVSLEFSILIDDSGTKNITVQDFWQGTDAENTFSCTSYAYTGTKGSGTVGTTINFTAPLQSKTTSVTAASGDTVQVICYNVPEGGAVAGLSWNK